MDKPESGFRRVTPFAEARERLRELCPPHGRTVRCSIDQAVGRALGTTVHAVRNVPHYDRAAMDGYAVRAEDTFGASEGSPNLLASTEGTVKSGTARQVHTGSAMPVEADAVVMVEHVDASDRGLAVYDAVAIEENVSTAGEDVTDGEHLFDAGHPLRPSDLALLRAAGVHEVEVSEPAQIGVIPTGEELVDPETEPEPGEVVETNGLLVSTLVERWGGDPTYREVVTDDEDSLRTAIKRDTSRDLLVTIGGSSVGERDLLPDVVSDLGEMVLHGVDIKPGHPVGFGIVDGTPILVLPGYPVSCLVTAVQFLRPAIAWLNGVDPSRLPSVRARLNGKLRSAPGERTFARVRLVDDPENRDGSTDLSVAEPVRVGGAGVMSSVAFADGWVVIPESSEGLPAGEIVDVQEWERP